MEQLTPKQQRFVDEYLVDFNASEAAKRAGYSPRSAHVQGCQLLKNPKVSRAILKRRTAMQEKIEVTQEWVLSKLVLAAERNMKDGEANSVAVRALELLGKHLALFTERTELTGKDGGPIDMSVEDARKELRRQLDGVASRLAGIVTAEPGGNGRN
jgi:phage terminase small subunit